MIELDLVTLRQQLPKRLCDAYKNQFGHVLVIGGDQGMSGSVRLAGIGALRVGAGLATLATHPDHAMVENAICPELMCYGVHQADDLKPLIEQSTFIVVGPGMKDSHWSNQLLKTAFSVKKPMLVDAGALNYLSRHPEKRGDWILTPHVGEAARLLATDAHAINQGRLASVEKLQQQYGGVAVLKGAGTLVSDGQSPVGVCPYGNPGMAKAGMGDLLSGVIGGVAAQGLNLTVAAQFGVCLQAKAADQAVEDRGERGLLAMDLLPYIVQLNR